mgnify:CR=1 FL=1
MSTDLLLSNNTINTIIDALETRAKEIDADTTELRTLFDCSESIGQLRYSNAEYENVTFTFNSVSKETAITELQSQTNPTLQTLGHKLQEAT